MILQKDKLNGITRAAVLLICLGEKLAAQVMREMSDEEIFKITKVIAKIEHIPEDIKNMVLDDFELSAETQAGMVIRGQEFAKKTIAGSGSEERVKALMKQFVSGTETRPLETIAKMQPAMVTGLLKREHPQTIALILSTQTPDHSSAIVANLPDEMQTDVIYRIATLDSVAPDVINRIETALQRELGIVGGEQDQRQVGGISKVVEILDQMENNLDADILDNLEEIDPDMAEEIRKLMFTFEDLVNVDGRSLQMILREVNNDSLTLAMKTASDELKEHIFSNMSVRAADMIKDDLEALGPVRLSEVETMQQTIIKISMKLEEEGKLILGKGGGDELV
jgi:flagellar motor switch protein FliG